MSGACCMCNHHSIDRLTTSLPQPVLAIHPRGDVTIGWVLSITAMAAVAITTVVGNAAVISALRRARRAPSHYPLASLAAADLLVGVAVLPVAAARELFVFHLPWAVCACWSTLDVLCCTASILSICALGWERWCGISAPLAAASRSRRAKVSAALVWPVSALVALPTAFIPSPRHFLPGEIPKACTVNTNTGYVFASVTCSFYVPASVMLVLYARILRALATPPPVRAHRGRSPCARAALEKCKSSRASSKHDVTAHHKDPVYTTPNKGRLSIPDAESSCPIPSPLKTSNSPGGIIPRQRRATRTIVRLMALFLFCWTPFFVMLPIDSLCGCVWDTSWQWCTWLGYANSALNPLVYACASASVRRVLTSSVSNSHSSSSRVSTDAPKVTRLSCL